MRTLAVAGLVVLLSSCDSKPAPTETPKAETPTPAPTVPPPDESQRFPKTSLISSVVVPKQLLGKAFMPGGTLGQFRKGKAEYDEFIAKTPSPTDAALILPDWKNALTDPKYEASFGGYFGHDAGRPIFVFTKGAWIAGIAGLEEKAADAEARKLAKALD